MKGQHAIGPLLRSVLVITGIGGIASLMLFGAGSAILNGLALAAVVPLVMGLLGDNLLVALFARQPGEPSSAKSSQHKPALGLAGNALPAPLPEGIGNKAA